MVHNYRAGLGNVGSYQASTKPFLSASIEVTGSGQIVQVAFPNVTQFITIENSGIAEESDTYMRVGFSRNGLAASNFILLNNGESYSADWRVSSVYLRTNTVGSLTDATASIIAGLTNIEADQLRNNWSGSIGVG